MSFSGEVKKELTEHVSKSRHCGAGGFFEFFRY